MPNRWQRDRLSRWDFVFRLLWEGWGRGVGMASFFRRKGDKKPEADPYETLLGTLPPVLRTIVVQAHPYGTDACSTVGSRSECLSQVLALVTSDDGLQYVPLRALPGRFGGVATPRARPVWP